MKDKRMIAVVVIFGLILGGLLFAHFASHHKGGTGAGSELVVNPSGSTSSATPYVTYTPPAQPVGPAFPAALQRAAVKFTEAMNDYSWHDASIAAMYSRAEKYALPNRITSSDAGDPQTWKTQLVDVHGVVSAKVDKAQTFNRVPVKPSDKSAIVRVWFTVTTTQDGQSPTTQKYVWDETFAKQPNGSWLMDSYTQQAAAN